MKGSFLFISRIVAHLFFLHFPSARAIESQCFVVAAAQAGHHNEKRTSYGHSLAVDPWGEVLVDGGDQNAPVILTCSLDVDKIGTIRQRIPMKLTRELLNNT